MSAEALYEPVGWGWVDMRSRGLGRGMRGVLSVQVAVCLSVQVAV